MEKIEVFRGSHNNDVNNIKESANQKEKEIKKTFDNISKELNLYYHKSTTMYYLGYAQMFAANINSLCSNQNLTDLSEYTSRFRDSINDSYLIDSLEILGSSLGKEEKKQYISLIMSISILLSIASKKGHEGYLATTHDDYLSCINERLQQLDKNINKKNIQY